jgi:glycosyltransferase involved in cell wall biosynthesis
MDILIYEPLFGGHYFAYLKHIAEGLRALDVQTTMAIPRAATQSDELRVHLSSLPPQVRIDPCLPECGWSFRQRLGDGFAHFEATLDRIKPDHVLAPDADDLLVSLGLAHRIRGAPKWPPIEGLMLSSRFVRVREPLSYRLKTQFILRAIAASPASRIFHLDDGVIDRIRGCDASLFAKMRLMPDPVSTAGTAPQEEALAALRLPPARYITCAGLLTRRKGVDLLLDAFFAGDFGKDVRLLLAGPVDESLRAEVEASRASGRVEQIDRYLSEAELNLAVSASALVCLPYPEHYGSSNMAIRSAGVGRPVLSSDVGWIGETVTRFNLGWACHVNDRPQFIDALRTALAAAPAWRLSEAGQRFVQFHSPATFAATWTQRLRQRLKLPDDPALRTWDWVRAALPALA